MPYWLQIVLVIAVWVAVPLALYTQWRLLKWAFSLKVAPPKILKRWLDGR